MAAGRLLDGPRAALLIVIAVWAITFDRLGALRHDRFGTFGFDLGIYDQAVWLLSRARDPFITVRGLEAFGHHVNLILFLLGTALSASRAGRRAGERRVCGVPLGA